MPLVTLEQIFARKTGVGGIHSFAECVPQNGQGFGSFDTVIDQILIKFSSVSRQLDLHLIDSCFPENYGSHAKKILVTNNYVGPDALDSRYYETIAPWFYAIYHGDPAIEDVEPTRALNCLIRRMDPIRQSWLYQLARHGLLDQGYVSFTMDVSRHHDQKEADYSENAQQIFERQFQEHCQTFAPEHEVLKHLVPYRSFDSSWNLDQVVMNSRFSLVLETYFLDPRMITLSEKTFRCLKLPRPWIVFSTRGTVQHLRDMGLDVLDDVVDHSYDLVDFEIDRQTQLLEIARDMATWAWTPELLQRCKQAAQHNKNLIAHWYQNYNQEIDAVIARALEKHRAL
jgi:hypothetical protein